MVKKPTASILRVRDKILMLSKDVRQSVELFNNEAQRVGYPTIAIDDIVWALQTLEEKFLIPENFVYDQGKRINVYVGQAAWSSIVPYLPENKNEKCCKSSCKKTNTAWKALMFVAGVAVWVLLLILI